MSDVHVTFYPMKLDQKKFHCYAGCMCKVPEDSILANGKHYLR